MAAVDWLKFEDDLVVMESEYGKGLYAKRDLPAGFRVYYYGKFYPNEDAVLRAFPANDQEYLIAKNKDGAHVDGRAVQPQYATMANHQPDRLATAVLRWDVDVGEYGQPFVELKRPVAKGTAFTVDYGPRYGYGRHNFQRGTGFSPDLF